MGRRSRRKVDAVIGVALVLGLIGSEMRPDGKVSPGGKLPSVIESGDLDLNLNLGEEEATLVDHSLVEELSRIKGLDENDEKGVVLPVLPMPKTTVRPDHCYSSFSGKDVVKQEAADWLMPVQSQPDCDFFQVPVTTLPLTDIQYTPTAKEMVHQRIGIGDHPDLQAELDEIVAAAGPLPSEQSPLNFSSAVEGDPQELLNEILADNEKLSFDPPVAPMSPKLGSYIDPTQDIFNWMDNGFAASTDVASSSHSPDPFSFISSSYEDSNQTHKTTTPDVAIYQDPTLDELLNALESENKPTSKISSHHNEHNGYDDESAMIDHAGWADPFMNTMEPVMKKRKADSMSYASSCASSSQCGYEFATEAHNHTYLDDPSTKKKRSNKNRVSSSGSDDTDKNNLVRCKDLADFDNLKIPFSYEDVVSVEPSVFNSMVNDNHLNDEQRTLMRAARRRAKNRNAARQCRQRRVDEVEDLSDEVEALERERNQVNSEMDEVDERIAEQRQINEQIQAFILASYSQRKPPQMNSEYRLQANPRNGSFSLVEQRGVRA